MMLSAIWQNRRLILFMSLICFIGCLWLQIEIAVKDIEKAKQETRNAYASLDSVRHKALNDSINYATKAVYVAENMYELRDQLSAKTVELTKAMSHKDVIRVAGETTSETEYIIKYDTVKIHVREPYHYEDRWLSVAIDTTLHISTRDSISMVITEKYRHKFLWWRWGKNGYDVSIANFNPHATITYNRTVINGKQ